MKLYDHVPIAYLRDFFTSWKRILDAREIGHVFFLPSADIAYRAHQFRDWATKQHMPLTMLDMHADLLEDEASLHQTLAALKTPAVIIARSAFLTNPDAPRLAHIIQNAWFRASQGLLIFHEGFPSQFVSLFARMPTTFHQHTLTFPLYPYVAINGYIKALTHDWGMTIKKSQTDAIYRACGGNIWLVTDIIRAIRAKPKTPITDCLAQESFQKKMHLFWESLPQAHRDLLVYKHDRSRDDTTQPELETYGFYFTEGPKHTLPEYLTTLIAQVKQHALVVESTKILFHKIDLTHAFSLGERRILSTLYAALDTPMSRNTLGEAFWLDHTKEQYSDWALDKLMSRLRRKVAKAHLPLQIVTKRGVGYVCRYSN